MCLILDEYRLVHYLTFLLQDWKGVVIAENLEDIGNVW